MTHFLSTFWHKFIILFSALLFSNISLANAQMQQQSAQNNFSINEIIDSGHRFFDDTSSGIGKAVENIFSKYGLPTGYILGEEASGAFIGGLTYGEGQLYTKTNGAQKIFWQGPSVGWDFGGQGSRLMILVYDLNNTNDIFGRYGGISGSAYFIAGVGFHVLKKQNILLVPIRTGIGARLGINIGYLKLTPTATWNPF